MPPFIDFGFRRENFQLWRHDTLDEHAPEPPPAITELPLERLAVFVRSHDTSAPLTRVPVYAVAEIGVIRDKPARMAETGFSVLQPLGLLGTDHVGFVSFDLTVLRQPALREALIARLEREGLLPVPDGSPRPVIGIQRLWVSTFVDPRLRMDALVDGDVGPNAVILRVSLDAGDLDGRVFDRAMTGMQNPSILDWRLSPSSFSVSGAMLVGEDGCEGFLPANLSTQQFRFVQSARTPHKREATIRGGALPGVESPSVPTSIMLGVALEYSSEWFGIGHSLGQVQYSLPLAPAERVKIAVVDWSRQDRVVREEETTFKESLVHQWTRDRTVSETVHSVLNAWQRGGAVMGGAAGSFASGGLGIATSLGASYTTSSDTRELAANSTQRISDAFHQASSAERELRSTVVVTGTQAESANVQTRMVSNYNHSHALTILYYEVLRHYRVITRAANARLAVFVDYSSALLFQHEVKDGDDLSSSAAVGLRRTIVEHAAVLDAELLDERLRPGFDATRKLACLAFGFKPPPILPTDDFLLSRFLLKITSGPRRAQSRVDVKLILKDGDPVKCYAALTPPRLDEDINLTQTMNANSEAWFTMVSEKPIRWGNIASIEFFQGGTSTDPWDIVHVHACTNAESIYWVMADQPPPATQLLPGALVRVPVTRHVPGPYAASELLTAEERCSVVSLMRHLHDHHGHYSRAVWRAEDPAARAKRLADTKVESDMLLDVVDNTLLDVFDKYIVMPVSSAFHKEVLAWFDLDMDKLGLPGTDYIEQLLTLPARGVFAEAKLGHCNASEIIEEHRFWDWQKSPIPSSDALPDITGVSPKPQGVATAAPTATAMPSSIINIATPTALPDPTGLKDSLSMMAALGQLRDASGSQQLGPMLQALSTNATALATASARTEEAKGLINQIRNATELTPAQRSTLIGKVLDARVQEQQPQQRAANQPVGGAPNNAPPSASGTTPPPAGGTTPPPVTTPGGRPNTDGDGAPNTGTSSPGGTRAPRASLTDMIPEKASWVLAFEGFHDVGPVAAAWGSIVQPGKPAELIDSGGPVSSPLKLDARTIDGNGSLNLSVQLANSSASVLEGSKAYLIGAAKSVTARIRPKTTQITEEALTEFEAREAATSLLAGTNLVHLELKSAEDIPPFTTGVPPKKRFHFVALHEGLIIS